MSVFDDFLRDLDNDTNYRILLALALEETRDSSHPILDLGPTEGSTPYLHAYCEAASRGLVTVEENILAVASFLKYASARHEVTCVSWDSAPIEKQNWSVAFLKHAPGDRRWADAMRLLNRCEIIVLHNTEPAADYGYHFSQIWSEFKYHVDVKTNGAWSSAVSNSHDLTKWRGLRFGEYIVSSGDDDIRTDPVAEAVERFLSTPIEEQR